MDVKLKNSNIIVHTGKKLKLEAGDSKPLLPRLKAKTSSARSATSNPAFFSLRSQRKVKREEIFTFANQLAVLLESGIPMLSSLEVLYQQTQDLQFGSIIKQIREDINAGTNLTQALSKFPKVFPKLFISMVRAAELGGQLPQILKLVSHYLQEQDKLDKKIKSAIVYPRFVFIFFIILLAGIIFGLVPKFEETFENFGSKLPIPTQMLLDFSRFALDNIFIEIFAIAALFILYVRFKRTEKGEFFIDKLKLQAPVFGDLILKSSLSKFCRTLKILMQSGITLVESLDVAGETAENVLFTKVLKNIKQGIVAGDSLSKKLGQFTLFPPMLVMMVATGEESGSLEKMLKNVSELYDTHVDSKISGITSIIEPALMIALGAVAIIVILALYLPIFNIGNLNF